MEKVGITQWLQPLPLAELAALITPYGFTGIGLQFIDDYHENSVFHPDVCAQALAVQQQYGVSYPAIGGNIFCRFNLFDPENTAYTKQVFADAIAAAKAVGAPVVMVPSFNKSKITCQEELEKTAQVLRAACLAAQDAGVTIASENVLTTEENLQLVQAVDCENFGLYFDTQNPYSFAKYDVAAQAEALLPHITQLHIKDGIDKGTSLLGQGNCGFFETMKVFKKGNYQGWSLSETNYKRLMEQTGRSLEQLIAADAKTIAAL